MQECPNCGSDLNGSLDRRTTGTAGSAPRDDAAAELVSCPDCDAVVDGFSPH